MRLGNCSSSCQDGDGSPSSRGTGASRLQSRSTFLSATTARPDGAAVARFACCFRRAQLDTQSRSVFCNRLDVVVRGKEIVVAIFKPHFRGGIDVNHQSDLFVDAQKLSGRHELHAAFICRYPELHDGFIPTVLLSAAVYRVEVRRFDLGQMIARVNRVALSVYKNQRFTRRAP